MILSSRNRENANHICYSPTIIFQLILLSLTLTPSEIPKEPTIQAWGKTSRPVTHMVSFRSSFFIPPNLTLCLQSHPQLCILLPVSSISSVSAPILRWLRKSWWNISPLPPMNALSHILQPIPFPVRSQCMDAHFIHTSCNHTW